jgi:hypothetical protein
MPQHGHSHSNYRISNLVSRINVGIGNAVGGRKHAGRVGRVTRGVRIVSNATAVGTGIAAVVALGTTIASGGLAAPIWFLVVGGVAVVANFAGVMVGSGANHLKITQYYDLMISIHAELCRLQIQMRETSDKLPHGMKEYWHNERKLFNMTMRRRGQEVVGVIGTAMSAAMMLSALGLLPIAPGASIGLFFASRAISSATTAGGIFNNKDRLSIYKEIICGYEQKFRNWAYILSREREDLANDILKEVFKKLNVNNEIKSISDEKQWRTFLVKYAVYKMLFSQSEGISVDSKLSFLNTDNKEKVVKLLGDELEKMVKRSPQGNYFGRTALLNQHDRSLVDLVPYIAIDLESKLMEVVAEKELMDRAKNVSSSMIHNLKINLGKDEFHESLPFYIRKAALFKLSSGEKEDKIMENVSQELRRYLKYGVLDRDAILGKFPTQGHAHGEQSIMHYHLSQLCDLLSKLSSKKRKRRSTKHRDRVLTERIRKPKREREI